MSYVVISVSRVCMYAHVRRQEVESKICSERIALHSCAQYLYVINNTLQIPKIKKVQAR